MALAPIDPRSRRGQGEPWGTPWAAKNMQKPLEGCSESHFGRFGAQGCPKVGKLTPCWQPWGHQGGPRSPSRVENGPFWHPLGSKKSQKQWRVAQNHTSAVFVRRRSSGSISAPFWDHFGSPDGSKSSKKIASKIDRKSNPGKMAQKWADTDRLSVGNRSSID